MLNPFKRNKPIKLISFSENLILTCNLVVARHLRECSRLAINRKHRKSLLKRAKVLEREYKALKKKYKNFLCTWVV